MATYADPTAMRAAATSLIEQREHLIDAAQRLATRVADMTFQGPRAQELRDSADIRSQHILLVADEIGRLASRIQTAAFELESQIASPTNAIGS